VGFAKRRRDAARGAGVRPGDPFPAKGRGAANNPDWELLFAQGVEIAGRGQRPHPRPPRRIPPPDGRERLADARSERRVLVQERQDLIAPRGR
jgi:hypothetical protein